METVSIRILDVRKEANDILVSVNLKVTDSPQFKSKEYTVTRNVNDFDRLYVYLRTCFPDVLTPTPPSMTMPEAPLIKYASRKFLTRVLLNETLSLDEGVISFFESEYLVLHLPSNIPGTSPKSRRHLFMSMFPTDLKDVDEQLERAKSEVEEFQERLDHFCNKAEEISKLEKSNAYSFAECALRFSKVEGHPFIKAAGIYTKIEELYHLHSRYLSGIFCELSFFQIQNTMTVQNCFQYRIDLLRSYDYACKRTQRKLDNMNSLKQSTTIKQEKVDLAIEDVQRAKQLEEEGRESLKSTTERVRSEYIMHCKHREQDILEQILSYAKKQSLLQSNVLSHLESFTS